MERVFRGRIEMVLETNANNWCGHEVDIGGMIVKNSTWLIMRYMWWATRSWKLCTRWLLLTISVYAPLLFPLFSHAARLFDQLISKFIPLGNGTPKHRQNRNCTTHSEKKATTLHNKHNVTLDGQSSVSLANARRTPTKYTTRTGSTHL